MNSTRRLARLGFTAFVLLVPCARAGAQGGAAIFPAPIHGGSLDELTSPKLVVGDLSGDGLPEAVLGVTSFFTSGSIQVLRGNAHGGLGTPTHHGGGFGAWTPYSLAIGDVTGDGIDDLVVSTWWFTLGYTVWVYAGNAQGTLGAPAEYPGSGVLAIGDVTGDGRPDLVRGEASQVCVMAGNSQGTLDPAVCYALSGNGYQSVAVGDVDGDGRADVVAASSSRVCVLRGNAQGTLDPPACRVTGGSDPDQIALGDVTGDGRSDAVLVDSSLTMVCAFAGNAQGSLDPAVCYASGIGEIWSIAVGDVSADGRQDVAVAGRIPNASDAGQVCVLRGNVGGTLDAPVAFVPGLLRPRSIALADLAGDGRLEVLVANQVANDVCILESDGQGGLEVAVPYETESGRAVAVGDVSGDGRSDVVQPRDSDDSVCVLKGNPQGTLDAPLCVPAGGSNPASIATGELSGDLRIDVVVSTDGGVCVLKGNAQGSLDSPECYPGTSGRLAVGDINGDARPDVVVSTSSGVCVLEANAQGTLDPPACVAAPEGHLALGDVNGDGRLDAVVAHAPSQSREVCVLAGNAQGGLDAPVCYPSDGFTGTVSDVAVGDVNGDGRADVFVTTQSSTAGGQGCLYLGNAQGTLDPPSCESGFGSPQGVEIADVSGDGLSDVVLGFHTADSDGSAVGFYVGVREGRAQPTLAGLQSHASGCSGLAGFALGDVDGDGRIDAVVPGGFFGSPDAGICVLSNQFPSLGTVSCLGGVACPCGNAGTGQRGCQNSASTGGARLHGDGVASLAEDSVRLFASGEMPSALTIFLQGDTAIPATNFGDGLRCAGGALKRLYVKSAAQGAASAPLPADPSISVRSAAAGDPLTAGDVRVYQTYYRDPNPTFCPSPTGNTFNSSNALTLTWNQ